MKMDEFDVNDVDMVEVQNEDEKQLKLYHLIDDLTRYCQQNNLMLLNHYNLYPLMAEWIHP